MNNYVEHSAKGSTWTKKDHKYIRKEGDRYIYPDDFKPGDKKSPYAVAIQNQNKAKRNRLKQDVVNTWEQNVSDPINSVNPLYKKKQEQAKIDAANERMNQREQRFNTINRLDEKQKEAELKARGITPLNPVQKQEAQKWMDSYVANNQRIIAEKKRQEANTRINRIRNQELVDRANRNRVVSSNPTGRTARETLSRRGVSKVAYGKVRTPDKTTVVRREMISKPQQYDERGIKSNSNISYKDTVVSQRNNGGARSLVSKRGNQKVTYSGSGKDRKRVVTNSNYSKTYQNVDGNAGRKDTRNTFKRSISSFKYKTGIGKAAIDKWKKSIYDHGKEVIKEKKKQERLKEKNLPFNIRFKKNVDRGKKALLKFFSKFNIN